MRTPRFFKPSGMATADEEEASEERVESSVPFESFKPIPTPLQACKEGEKPESQAMQEVESEMKAPSRNEASAPSQILTPPAKREQEKEERLENKEEEEEQQPASRLPEQGVVGTVSEASVETSGELAESKSITDAGQPVQSEVGKGTGRDRARGKAKG